jgi:hypothetical protein
MFIALPCPEAAGRWRDALRLRQGRWVVCDGDDARPLETAVLRAYVAEAIEAQFASYDAAEVEQGRRGPPRPRRAPDSLVTAVVRKLAAAASQG